MTEKLLMVAERRAYHLFVYFMLTKINEVLFQVKADSLSEAAGLQVGSSSRMFCNFSHSIFFFYLLWLINIPFLQAGDLLIAVNGQDVQFCR